MSIRKLTIGKSITNRESQSIEKYLLEIKKLRLNTPEEELRLAILIRQGDKNAYNSLVQANLRFVVSVAKQYQHHGLSLDDLINEGNLGLMQAAHNFDHTRGFKFISFAVWRIRQHIMYALASNGRTVRLPMNKVTMRNQVQKAASQLEQVLGRTASVEELAEELSMNETEIASCLHMNERQISLDTPLREDEEGCMLDVLENPHALSVDHEISHTASLKVDMDRFLHVLNDRQREMVCCFFGIGMEYPMSLEELGLKYNLTTERIRQIKDKAICILRGTKNIKSLRSFLAA